MDDMYHTSVDPDWNERLDTPFPDLTKDQKQEHKTFGFHHKYLKKVEKLTDENMDNLSNLDQYCFDGSSVKYNKKNDILEKMSDVKSMHQVEQAKLRAAIGELHGVPGIDYFPKEIDEDSPGAPLERITELRPNIRRTLGTMGVYIRLYNDVLDNMVRQVNELETVVRKNHPGDQFVKRDDVLDAFDGYHTEFEGLEEDFLSDAGSFV